MFGGSGSGFGSPGVRETKQANASTEVRIPAQQTAMIWVLAFAVYVGVYILLNRLISSASDWTLLVVIVHVAVIAVLMWRITRVVDIIPQSGDLIDISVKVVALVIIVLAVAWYYSNIVPVIVSILMTDTITVLIAGAVLSIIYAATYGKEFYIRQLTDSLRDSDSKYAINAYNREHGSVESDKLDWEIDKYERGATPQVTASVSESVTPPLLVKTSPKVKLLTAQQAYNTAFMEFLDGLKDGDFSTDEASWKGKVLDQSGYKVTSIGGDVREALISSGWAMWNHPESKNQGWKIRPGTDIEEIKRHVHDGKIDK